MKMYDWISWWWWLVAGQKQLGLKKGKSQISFWRRTVHSGNEVQPQSRHRFKTIWKLSFTPQISFCSRIWDTRVIVRLESSLIIQVFHLCTWNPEMDRLKCATHNLTLFSIYWAHDTQRSVSLCKVLSYHAGSKHEPRAYPEKRNRREASMRFFEFGKK